MLFVSILCILLLYILCMLFVSILCILLARVRAYIYSRTRYAIRAYIILIDTKVQLYLQLYAKYIILLASMHN